MDMMAKYGGWNADIEKVRTSGKYGSRFLPLIVAHQGNKYMGVFFPNCKSTLNLSPLCMEYDVLILVLLFM